MSLNVVVVGMHRSGTSAVAGALDAAGITSGAAPDLLPAIPDNPRGYHELRRIMEFNDRLLAANGWTWDTPPASAPSESPPLEQFVTEGRSLADELLPRATAWVLKDPRLGLLMHWWRQILLDRFVVVVTLRPAAEVAWSLHLRDGFSVELGLSLWAAYHRHMAHGLAGLPVVTVDYPSLAQHPDQMVPRLLTALQHLGVVVDIDSSAAVAAIEPQLRRATPPDGSLASRETDSILQVEAEWGSDAVHVHERFALTTSDPSPWEIALLEAHRKFVEGDRRSQAELQRLHDEREHSDEEHRAELQRLHDEREHSDEEHRAELQRLHDERERSDEEHRAELQRLHDEREHSDEEHRAELQRLRDEREHSDEEHRAELQRLHDERATARKGLMREVERRQAASRQIALDSSAAHAGPAGAIQRWRTPSQSAHPRLHGIISTIFRFRRSTVRRPPFPNPQGESALRRRVVRPRVLRGSRWSQPLGALPQVRNGRGDAT